MLQCAHDPAPRSDGSAGRITRTDRTDGSDGSDGPDEPADAWVGQTGMQAKSKFPKLTTAERGLSSTPLSFAGVLPAN
jgi:hypothetical protein